MLKDITLGQYYQAHSPIHGLDPRLKIVLTFTYVVVLMIATKFVSFGVLALYAFVAWSLSRVPVKLALRGMRPLLLIMVLTSFINLFMTPGREIWRFWGLTLTYEGLLQAAIMLLRLVLLILGTTLLTFTTTPIELTDGLEFLMAPLKRFGVPSAEIAMMMTIAIRFIPNILDETDKIIKAQKARGADFDHPNPFKRAKSLLPILIPLFVSAFRRADELAVSMESRLYGIGIARTRMKQLKFKRTDVLMLTCACIFFLTSIIVGIVI